LKNTIKAVDTLTDKKNVYSESKPFNIDYSAKMTDLFNVFSYKKTDKYPGADSNLEGKANAYTQTSEIYGNDRLGTIISPKGKRYYDFSMHVEIMTRHRGACGVVFRMVDPFNFLAFEISINGGYKRLIKVANGSLKELKRINDGGVPQNEWFKVEVKAERSKFKIRMGDRKKYTNYGAAPIIFEFEDIDFPKGEVGLFTNGNSRFYFDALEIKAFPCQTQWEPNKTSDFQIITNSARIYDELFDLSFPLK
jgi:hypothetical protein